MRVSHANLPFFFWGLLMDHQQRESLERLGFSDFFQTQLRALSLANKASGTRVARVVSEARGEYAVVDGDQSRRAILAGRLNHAAIRVCVGDFVLLESAEYELERIVHVFERTSLFQRRSPGGTSEAQAIAANVDLAIVVCALAPDDADPHAQGHGLNPRRIERYLRAIRDAPARPLVLLNKADLSPHCLTHAEQLRRRLPGVPVLVASAEAGSGLSELAAHLEQGTTAVLVGSSGVGKSSLVNRLMRAPVQRVGAVRAMDTRGRHTTTGRELFTLPGGGLMLDTPGMRELQLWADEAAVDSTFDDIAELAAACRFNDCRHGGEPGCAVQAAIDDGRLGRDRFASHQKLERELAHAERKGDARAAAEERRRWKHIHKQVSRHMHEKYGEAR